MADEQADVFAAQRDVLHGVAYRILGRRQDSEDVVQEAWLRWSGVDSATIGDPRAFLVRVTTRLAIDRLRRIKARREEYVGPWLPEPLLTAPDIAQDVETAESVSIALLIVLETLSPLERAVFILRQVFGYSFAEVGAAVGRGEVAARQVATRARNHVRARRPRFPSDLATRRSVTDSFVNALRTGDIGTLMDVLAPDVTLVADGGGKVHAPRLPVRGASAVARFLVAIAREPLPDLRVDVVELNGAPGLLVGAQGQVVTVIDLDVLDTRIQAIHLIANPDKLRVMSTPVSS
jgi:RNA polymerase sigma-70 factor, ECF subfamily